MHYALFTLTDMSAEKSEQVGPTKIVGWHVSPQIGVICCSFIYETVHVGRLSANVFFGVSQRKFVGPICWSKFIDRHKKNVSRHEQAHRKSCNSYTPIYRADMSADTNFLSVRFIGRQIGQWEKCIRQPIFLIALNLTIGSLNDSKFRNCC